MRHLVAVTNCCHGDDRPPESIRNAVYLWVRVVKFCIVYGTGEDKQTNNESDEEQSKTLNTGPECQQ